MRRTTPLLATLAGAAFCSAPAHGADYYIADRDVAALVAAIQRANASPAPDVIHLAQGGLYALDGESAPGVALPPLEGRLRIEGRGAELRRATSQPLALIEVAAEADVEIEGLTLAEGSRGSVRNFGRLRLSRSAIVDGTTYDESAIVQNFGRMDASDCVIGYNQVGGAGRDAGIVLNYGTMHLERCRVEGNSLGRRYPTLVAATLLNYGELVLEAIALDGNAVIDGFGGAASATWMNLGNGRLLAEGLMPTVGPQRID